MRPARKGAACFPRAVVKVAELLRNDLNIRRVKPDAQSSLAVNQPPVIPRANCVKKLVGVFCSCGTCLLSICTRAPLTRHAAIGTVEPQGGVRRNRRRVAQWVNEHPVVDAGRED